MKNKMADNIIFLLVGSLYAYCLNVYIMSLTILQVPNAVLFLTGSVMLIVFFVFFYNKYTLIILAVVLFLALLYILFQIPALMETPKGKLYESAMYARDTFLFVMGYLPYEERYTYGIIMMVSLVLTLFITLSFYISFNFYMLSFLGFTVFIGSQMMGRRVEEFPFLSLLLCNLIFFCKKMNLMSLGKINKKRNGIFTLCILPLCIIIVMLAYVLPSPKSDFKQYNVVEVFQNQFMKVNDLFYGAFNPKYFSFQSTGFSQNPGRLGGNVALNDRSIMTVYSDESVYLRGITKDTYTGDYWINADDQFTDYTSVDFNIDQMETLTNFMPYLLRQGKHLDDALTIVDREKNTVVKRSNVTIQIGDNRTGTLFTVLKNDAVEPNEVISIQANNTGNLKAESLLEKGSGYSYGYLYVDYGNENIIDILRLGHKGDYAKIVAISGADSDNGLHIMQEYAEKIYKQYTTLPESVPKRVYEQAESLTNGESHDYDKIKALETYLRKFPYTLTPGTVPDNQDFVDYFLFEGRKGYCTYYASALAVMSRCIGVPSRYVEGYILPPIKNDDGSYTVTNKYAHAWAEIYFEGFGWVPFEATAPYTYSFYKEEMPFAENIFAEDMMSSGQYAEVVHDLGYDREENVKNETVLAEPLQPRSREQVKQDEIEKTKNIFASIGYGFIFLICMILSVYLFYGFRLIQERSYLKKIKERPLSEQVIIYFKRMIKMADYYHYPLRGQETPQQYADRIGKRFTFDNETLFMRDMVRIYYKAEYGGGRISEEERDSIKDAYFEFLGYIESMRWKPVFVFNKYFIRRI